MSTYVRRWEDFAQRKRMTLVRGQHDGTYKDAEGVSHTFRRDTTVELSPEEQLVIAEAVLEDLGLGFTYDQRKVILDGPHPEIRIRDLEKDAVLFTADERNTNA